MKRIILSLSIALAGVLNMQAEKKDFPVDFSIDGFDYQIVKDHGGNLLSVWVADDEEPYKTGTVTIPTSFLHNGKNCVVTAINYYWPTENGITKLIVPIGLDSILNSAFFYCSALQEVDIQYVKYIGDYAFYGTSIKQLDLSGAYLKQLGQGAFDQNKQMTKLTISAPQLKELPDFAFAMCEKLSDISLGLYITKLGRQAFAINPALTTITLPASIISLGDEVFYNDENLKEIKVLAMTPPTCTTKTFDGLDKSKIKVIVPIGRASAYKNATGWKDMNISDGTQAVEQVEVSQDPSSKTIENGQILIRKDDKIYTLTGNEVR